MQSVPRVYADFNAIEYPSGGGVDAVIALTGYGTLASLARQRLWLREGMKLMLYEPNDIECEGVAHFDKARIDPAGRLGEWVAHVNHTLVKANTTETHEPSTHPCSGCGEDLNAFFRISGRSYSERCPLCNTSVMAPLAHPENAT
jgi:hypothetical protein